MVDVMTDVVVVVAGVVEVEVAEMDGVVAEVSL